MNVLRRTMQWANAVAAVLSGCCIFAMMLVGAGDVIGVEVFKSPIPGAFEITEILMVASVFLAVSLAQARKQHVRVELLLSALPAGLQDLLLRVGYAMTAVFFGFIAWVGWGVAIDSYMVGEFSSGIIRVPVTPARFALAVGATLITLQALLDVFGPAYETEQDGPSGEATRWTP